MRKPMLLYRFDLGDREEESKWDGSWTGNDCHSCPIMWNMWVWGLTQINLHVRAQNIHTHTHTKGYVCSDWLDSFSARHLHTDTITHQLRAMWECRWRTLHILHKQHTHLLSVEMNTHTYADCTKCPSPSHKHSLLNVFLSLSTCSLSRVMQAAVSLCVCVCVWWNQAL